MTSLVATTCPESLVARSTQHTLPASQEMTSLVATTWPESLVARAHPNTLSPPNRKWRHLSCPVAKQPLSPDPNAQRPYSEMNIIASCVSSTWAVKSQTWPKRSWAWTRLWECYFRSGLALCNTNTTDLACPREVDGSWEDWSKESVFSGGWDCLWSSKEIALTFRLKEIWCVSV
jgi:hypothetical protein